MGDVCCSRAEPTGITMINYTLYECGMIFYCTTFDYSIIYKEYKLWQLM